jgi:hypothetical protein
MSPVIAAFLSLEQVLALSSLGENSLRFGLSLELVFTGSGDDRRRRLWCLKMDKSRAKLLARFYFYRLELDLPA